MGRKNISANIAAENKARKGVETYVLDTTANETAGKIAARENGASAGASNEVAQLLASMRVASETMSDPLGQELRLTLQEQRMGLSVNQAIESLGKRADAPNMRIFVRALTQGERLGVSIGSTMRNLSLEMRKRRRAMAEERAQKMPINMLFPLIFCIFPALFVVILTPMIINIVEALG